MPTGSSAYPGAADNFDVTKADGDLVGQDLADVRAAVNAIEVENAGTRLDSVESGDAWAGGVDGYVLTYDDAGNPAWVAGGGGSTVPDPTTGLAGDIIAVNVTLDYELVTPTAVLAADVPFTPAGTIAATNVQTAIEEVAAEKQAASVIAASGKGYVNHGATAGTARPSGYASVEWVGSVVPTNAVNGDTWIDTT